MPNDARRASTLRVSLLFFTALLALWATPSSAAETAPLEQQLRGTPFEGGLNAQALPALSRGKTVRRTTTAKTITTEDVGRIHALGVERPDAAAVALHFIPRTDLARQIARLTALTHDTSGFTPAGVCDRIDREGDGKGLCLTNVDGPLGKAPVRLPFATRLERSPDGALHFTMRNMRPLEVKAMWSWTPVVATGLLGAEVDFYPVSGGWYVFTRIALSTSERAAAKPLLDAMLALDGWLCQTLGHS